MAEQLAFFETPVQEPVKVKYAWSVYAVPKYYDGGHIETTVNAYSEKQARFLFYKNHSDYIITGIYRI